MTENEPEKVKNQGFTFEFEFKNPPLISRGNSARNEGHSHLREMCHLENAGHAKPGYSL